MFRMTLVAGATGLFLACGMLPLPASATDRVDVGPRPYYLVDRLNDGPLKEKLSSCTEQSLKPTMFSIAHRGAALMFPEHTEESYRAAARMGAGIVECDVTFTKDKELVCRHAQNDLHRSTNILATDLAKTCHTPFTPASGDSKAAAECRTNDLTVAEFKTLSGKMDGFNAAATTVEGYMDGTPNWRTDLYAGKGGKLMTHAESIQLFKELGVKFTPEVKSPIVSMPFDGFSQHDYVQKLVDEYKAADVPAKDVWIQSFNLDDILYLIKNEPEFGAQAVLLDEGKGVENWDPMTPETWLYSMQDLADMGVKYLAPPTWALVTTDASGKLALSTYAKEAKKAGLKLIAWTLERSGPLHKGGGWYFQSVSDITTDDADYLKMLHFLAQEVGVEGVFSDWPATVTYYANCMGLK